MFLAKLNNLKYVAAVLALFQTGYGHSNEVTGTDLLNLLLEQQLITAEQAKALVATVDDRSPEEVPDNAITAMDVLTVLVESGAISQQSFDQLMFKIERRREAMAEQEAQVVEEGVAPDTVRVPYMPDYVRDELYESLKFAVESDVVDKVKDEAVRTARVYGWGIKEAPSWVHTIKVSGDVRFRAQADLFPSDNSYGGQPDYVAINEDGLFNNQFTNVEDDRYRLRSRVRLQVKAKPFERVETGFRLVTGDPDDPVSSNQTLGNYGQKWDASFDLGYIKYKTISGALELQGGRVKNPFFHTDLVYDSDFTFEGISASYYFLRDDSFVSEDRRWDPYVTLGAFAMDEFNSLLPVEDTQENRDIVSSLNSRDKYLFAFQLGADFKFYNTNQLSMALAYYNFDNFQGKRNPDNKRITDITAPPFFQVGNSVFLIANETENGVPTYQLFGLASKFELLNATIEYKMANFFPTFLFLQADYVKNIGFDKNEVSELRGGDPIRDRSAGYQLGIAAGTQTLQYRRDWRIALTYRHLEGDAVVDAFADSDFFLGGTDAKGYILQGSYSFFDDVVGSIKWMSADSIDIDPDDSIYNLSVDTLQLDITASF